MTESLEAWREFNVAMLGATAALAGLVIVAMSVNIGTLVASRSLTARLAAGIAALVLAIAVAAAGLVPDLDARIYGAVIIVLGVVSLVFPLNAARTLSADASPQRQARGMKTAIAFAPAVLYLIGGSLLLGGVAGGMLVVATASLVAIVASLVIAWVALVEVLR